MEPRRIEVWSLPDDPAGFRALLELPITAAGTQDPDDTPGKGSISLAPDYEDLDAILASDPTDVAASVSTLICMFGDHSPTVPDFEFFADERVDPIGPGLTTISGPDIRSGLNDGKVHPRAPGDPIWLWGQPPITRNSDLTEGLVADEEFDIWVVATAGVWRIDLGATGWSGNIDWDATNTEVKTAIEAGPSSVVEVNVTGSGTTLDPWRIHIVNPAQINYSVQVDDGLTGDIFVRFISDGGEVKATYYTPAQTVDGALFGIQGAWRVENDPLDGQPSILVAGNSAFIGVQQILSGVGGIHGYATVDIRPLVYGANFRLGIRDIDEAWLYTVEDFIDVGVGYVTLTLPTVEISQIIDQIILRGAVIDDAPPDFYLRNLKFHRGMPGTSFGDITLQLVGAAQTRGVLAWLDTSGITTTTDFNGNAWDNMSLEFRADPGMDLGTHVMGDGREAGYEYDIVRKVVPVGALTHQLRVWNRLGRGAVKTVDPAVIAGDITSGSIAKRRLPFTHLLVEYGTLQFTEVTHVDFTGLARREGFIRAEQATDEATATQIGETYLLDQVDDLLATQVNPTSINPYEHVDVGDELPYELGKHAGRHSRRIHTIATTLSNDVWSAELTGSHLFSTEQAAMWEAIRRLQEAFDRKNFNRETKPILPQLAGGKGGSAPSIVVAASDAGDKSKESAHYICTGTGQDQLVINNAAEELDEIVTPAHRRAGRLLLTEGIFKCHGIGANQAILFDLQNGGTLQGMGRDATKIQIDTVSGANSRAIWAGIETTIRDLSIDINPATACDGIYLGGYRCRVDNVWIAGNGGKGIVVTEDLAFISDFIIETGGRGIDIVGSFGTQIRSGYIYTFANGGVGIYAQGLDSGVIDGVVLSAIWEHGIQLNECVDCLVYGNNVRGASLRTGNTYDAYLIDGNSHRNQLFGNRAAPITASQIRYGFNINPTAGNINYVYGNLARGISAGTFGTAAYNAIAATVVAFPGAAAPQGDNFV